LQHLAVLLLVLPPGGPANQLLHHQHRRHLPALLLQPLLVGAVACQHRHHQHHYQLLLLVVLLLVLVLLVLVLLRLQLPAMDAVAQQPHLLLSLLVAACSVDPTQLLVAWHGHPLLLLLVVVQKQAAHQLLRHLLPRLRQLPQAPALCLRPCLMPPLYVSYAAQGQLLLLVAVAEQGPARQLLLLLPVKCVAH
jgi:hypothetical protein